MARNISIEKIGIETELSLLAQMEDKMVNNEYFSHGSIKVCNDDEYYGDQIEYKMFPEAFDDNAPKKIDEFCDFIMSRPMTAINGGNWVGTHVHMFINKNGEPNTTMFDCKLPIVAHLMRELVNFFIERLEANDLKKGILQLELQRLTHSHNIWRYFDTERLSDALRTNLLTFGSDYQQFSKGVDRPKYAPVIWSLANVETGKPLTLELRLFPNSYLLVKGGVGMCKTVKECFELARIDDEYSEEEVKQSIVDDHFRLVSAYFFVKKGNFEGALKALKIEL